ncbi:helix-turn-helix domain-containing protein [Serratia marcescens]|uniref:helix-turn-helix domain-containing protein n=1 Tax=Serratia marcescens TaxID=615 RepID=UPI003204BA83
MKTHNTSGMHAGEMLSNVMTMNGIPKHKHVSHIRDVLNVSTPQAQRKLKGTAPWEMTQLEQVVRSLGLSMSQFFTMFENELSEKQEAILNIEKLELPCKIYLSKENSKDTREYSAIKVNDKWHVFKTEEIEGNELYSEARRFVGMIIIESGKSQLKRKRIALLDDDKDVLDSISEIIGHGDYVVNSFNNISDIESKIDTAPYDAYVMDWIIHDKSAYETIRKIRESKKPHAMIIVLTGQDSEEVDDEIATAISDFDIIGPFSKPLKINSIQRLIDKYFLR